MTRARREVLAVAVSGVVAALALTAVLMTRDGDDPARGELIAYSCKEPGNAWYAICAIRTDGTGRRRLTTRVPATDPAWSPDGHRIAFTRREAVGEYTPFSEDDVYVMDADGDGQHQLSEEREGVHAVQPAWSPDGREIVFTRAVEPPFSGLWVVPAKGGPPRRLTGEPGRIDGSATWSPDSTRVAFTRTRLETESTGAASVLVMRRDGTNVRELVRNRYFSCCTSGLSWSPDGRTIAFETSPSRLCTAISLVDVATGAIRPLTTCARARESALSPSWQPDATVGER